MIESEKLSATSSDRNYRDLLFRKTLSHPVLLVFPFIVLVRVFFQGAKIRMHVLDHICQGRFCFELGLKFTGCLSLANKLMLLMLKFCLQLLNGVVF